MGRSFLAPKDDVAHGLFECAKRRQVFGRASGDEARAVAKAADVDRQGLDGPAGQAFEQIQREPNEPGAAGEGEQASRAETEDRDGRGRVGTQPSQDGVEGKVGFVERDGRRVVEVDPRVAGKVLRGDGSGEQLQCRANHWLSASLRARPSTPGSCVAARRRLEYHD